MRFIILSFLLCACIQEYTIVPGNDFAQTSKYINVKTEFQIVGDSITDWADQIQNVIDVAIAGDVIYFPRGKYIIGKQLTSNKTLTFTGDGYYSILKFINNTNGIVFQGATQEEKISHCRVEKLRVLTSFVGATTSGITFRNSYENSVDWIYLSGFANNLVLHNTYADKILNSRFVNYRTNAVLMNNTGTDIDAGDRNITNCTFVPTGQLPLASIKQFNGGGTKITACKFNGSNSSAPKRHYHYSGTAPTVDLLITGSSFENFTMSAIYLDIGASTFNDVTITGNQLAYGSASYPTIYAKGIQGIAITGNIMRGNGTNYAIVLENCYNGLVLNAYSSYITGKPISLINCVNIRAP